MREGLLVSEVFADELAARRSSVLYVQVVLVLVGSDAELALVLAGRVLSDAQACLAGGVDRDGGVVADTSTEAASHGEGVAGIRELKGSGVGLLVTTWGGGIPGERKGKHCGSGVVGLICARVGHARREWVGSPILREGWWRRRGDPGAGVARVWSGRGGGWSRIGASGREREGGNRAVMPVVAVGDAGSDGRERSLVSTLAATTAAFCAPIVEIVAARSLDVTVTRAAVVDIVGAGPLAVTT